MGLTERRFNRGCLSAVSFVPSASVCRGRREYYSWMKGVRLDSCQVIILISYPAGIDHGWYLSKAHTGLVTPGGHPKVLLSPIPVHRTVFSLLASPPTGPHPLGRPPNHSG